MHIIPAPSLEYHLNASSKLNTDMAFLERTRERLERFRAVPPARALLAEVRLAQERASRGEPAHYGEMIARLMRVAFARNAVLDERLAQERETSVAELRRLRDEVISTAVAAASPWRRRRLRSELDRLFQVDVDPPQPGRLRRARSITVRLIGYTPGLDRLFNAARFPFRHDRHVPTLIVRSTAGDDSLDPTFRSGSWPEERKRALIERGYRLADDALRVRGGLAEVVRPDR